MKDRGNRYSDRRGDEGRGDMGETLGNFIEEAADGIGKIFRGGRGESRGRGMSSAVTSLCDAIDQERESLEMLCIIGAEYYDSWISKLERVHSILSNRPREANMSHGVASFIDELRGERAEFERR